MAISRPSQSNYLDLLDGFNPESLAPYLWIFASSVFAFGVAIAAGYYAGTDLGVWVVCGPAVIGIVAVVVWAILVGLVDLFARRLFGGSGSFPQLFYLSSAATAPLGIAIALIPAIVGYGTSSRLLLLIPYTYEIILITLATKVVHDLRWLKAAVLIVPFFGISLACETLA